MITVVSVLLLLRCCCRTAAGFQANSRINKLLSSSSRISVVEHEDFQNKGMPSGRWRWAMYSSSRDDELAAPSTQLLEQASTRRPSKPLPPPPVRPSIMTSAEIMRVVGTSPRRVVVSSLSATGVALIANLFGVTSAILGQVPEVMVQNTGLDTYYPRNGFKRYNSRWYTFLVPQEWVGDTALELQKAALRVKPLDYSMRQGRRSSTSVLPDVGTNFSLSTSTGRS
jgi:hypothetical protein